MVSTTNLCINITITHTHTNTRVHTHVHTHVHAHTHTYYLFAEVMEEVYQGEKWGRSMVFYSFLSRMRQN